MKKTILTQEVFIALLTIELMRIGFQASIGENKMMVKLENKKCSMFLYNSIEHNFVTAAAYRTSGRQAFKEKNIFSPTMKDITGVIDTITKNKLL
jgi:hypothetical protein